jgi:transposase-like protein
MKCPRCENETKESHKEWNYAAFHVKKFECKKCRQSFMAYFHKGKFSHTIPKKK